MVLRAATLCALLAFWPGSISANPGGPAIAPGPAPAAGCRPNPLGSRLLYLRGDFNAWAANDDSALRWSCDHFEGVVAIDGKTRFKLGDEGWSADADFGADPAHPGALRLLPKGREIDYTFHGTHRIRLAMAQDEPTHPTLAIEDCRSPPVPASSRCSCVAA
jgi:hypothetical protein